MRDPRNPIVSCVVEPSSGHEIDDPAPLADGPLDPVEAAGTRVFVVGGGPAGLEAARVAAALGHPVRLAEAGPQVGRRNRFPVVHSGNPNLGTFADWLHQECVRLGVAIETAHRVDASEVAAAHDRGDRVILATGSRDGERKWDMAVGDTHSFVSAADLAMYWFDEGTGEPRLPGEGQSAEEPRTVVVLDPIGGPIGVAMAEALAARERTTVHLVTQDNLAGNELARTGDLAAANARLQQAGVIIERRSIPRSVGAPEADGRMPVVIEDRFTGEPRTIRASFVIDAGFRLPDEELFVATGGVHVRAGDCVAPRTVHEAILEGRRAAIAVHEGRHP